MTRITRHDSPHKKSVGILLRATMMMTMSTRTLLLLLPLLGTSCAFLCIPKPPQRAAVSLYMGLYDTPLPPQPSDDNNDDSNTDDDDEQEYLWTVSRLFQMQPDGQEARGLLPRLGRTLESGVGCYFEPTDRKVQNLVQKTQCHAEDVAWALEACKGDAQEAWLHISTARRILLNKKVAGLEQKETDWDSELSALLQTKETEVIRPVDREAYEKRKESIAKEAKKQQEAKKRKGLFDLGTPDEPWLPTQNPNPIDDEPWFTG